MANNNSIIEKISSRFSLNSLTGNTKDLINFGPVELNSKGFPLTLDRFRLFDYYTEV
jgi:hypothetical protein